KILGSAEEKRALAERAGAFSEQDLIRFFDMLLRLESELRWTSQARFHLEVGFVKLAKIGHVRDIEEVLREVKGGGGTLSVPKSSPVLRAPEPKREVKPIAPPPARVPPASSTSPESSTFADMFTRRAEDKLATTAV